MSAIPVRPATVPANATWMQKDKEWRQVTIDVEGRRQGLCTYWRQDGTLVNHCYFKDDVLNGPFLRYHESGEISQVGQFVAGKVDGPRVFFRTKSKTTENFPPGVGENVRSLVMIYENGETTSQKCYAWSGEECLQNGSPLPKLPAGVPEDSTFDHREKIWVHGKLKRDKEGGGKGIKDGVWRKWTREGRLFSEANFKDGELHGVAKEFSEETGELEKSVTFNEGVEHGPAVIFIDDGHFFRPGRCKASGNVDQGEWVGQWTFEQNGFTWTMDMGGIASPEEIINAGLVSNQLRKSEEWLNAYEAFLKGNKPASALLALIRYTANAGDRSSLFSFLRARTLGLSDEASLGKADAFVEENEAAQVDPEALEESWAVAVQEFMLQVISGAKPETILRGAAIFSDQNNRALLAEDFMRVALMLAPERKDFHVNATLIAMSLGRADLAHKRAAMTKADDPATGEYLQKYVNVSFRPFFFIDPETEMAKLPPVFEPVEASILKDLEAVRSKLTDSLGWLTVVRTLIVGKLHPEVKEHLPKLTWLPPDFSDLVGADVIKEQEEHIERIENEALPDLLREAHKIWRFVCTICWAVGMNEVGLPTQIAPAKGLSRVIPAAWGRDVYLNSGGGGSLPPFYFLDMRCDEIPENLYNWALADVEGYCGGLSFLTVDGDGAPLELDYYSKYMGDEFEDSEEEFDEEDLDETGAEEVESVTVVASAGEEEDEDDVEDDEGEMDATYVESEEDVA